MQISSVLFLRSCASCLCLNAAQKVGILPKQEAYHQQVNPTSLLPVTSASQSSQHPCFSSSFSLARLFCAPWCLSPNSRVGQKGIGQVSQGNSSRRFWVNLLCLVFSSRFICKPSRSAVAGKGQFNPSDRQETG